MSEVYYVCRDCAPGKTLAELRDYKPIVERGGGTTTWDCPECGARILTAFDAGAVDLDLVRHALDLGEVRQDTPLGVFEIFP